MSDINLPTLDRGEGTVHLSAWEGFYIAAKDLCSDPSDGEMGIEFFPPLDGTDPQNVIKLEDGSEVTKAEVAAYEYLLDNQNDIRDAIMRSLLDLYPSLKDIYDYDEEVAEIYMPAVDSVDDFKKMIQLHTVFVNNIEKDDVAYVGFQFHCSWDEEHGMGAMTHKSRVVEIGEADISFGHINDKA